MSEEDESKRNEGVQKHDKPTPKTPTEMVDRLTKRNAEYMFRLKKALAETKLSAERQTQAYSEMLPQLIEGQKKGQTARQQFGTVTERVQAIVDGPKKGREANTNRWLVMLDNTLMIFMIFTLMYGITGMLSKQPQKEAAMGILSLVIVSLAAGFGSEELMRLIGPRDKKKKRMAWWKLLLMGVGGFIVLMLVYIVTSMIPGPLNAVLPGVVYLVLGAVTFVVRLYLKRRFNIQGTMF
ncbi:DUF1129 domain-containing protein [Loigolactobacillus iwatensis]|uniref:DUF1129 domain-containing protein n=1 Tax=Loigolactobacillus iwatensis TaxID=1267156 RepID=UPI000F7D83F6|nr:DUF1129 domain-containing protein [Loigolactobacillus iwatensis]